MIIRAAAPLMPAVKHCPNALPMIRLIITIINRSTKYQRIVQLLTLERFTIGFFNTQIFQMCF